MKDYSEKTYYCKGNLPWSGGGTLTTVPRTATPSTKGVQPIEGDYIGGGKIVKVGGKPPKEAIRLEKPTKPTETKPTKEKTRTGKETKGGKGGSAGGKKKKGDILKVHGHQKAKLPSGKVKKAGRK